MGRDEKAQKTVYNQLREKSKKNLISVCFGLQCLAQS